MLRSDVEKIESAEDQDLRVRRLAHAFSRNPDAPYEVHTMEKVTLPCTTFIRMLPTPLLWHPEGHPGLRCKDCGAVFDETMTSVDLVQGHDGTGPGWGYVQ